MTTRKQHGVSDRPTQTSFAPSAPAPLPPVLTDGTRSFAYDDENEMINAWRTNAWRTNVWRNDFVYDGKMRRRVEKDFTWTGSAWSETNEIRFIYDGNLVLQEWNTNNQPVVAYTRGTDLSGIMQGADGIGGLLARSQNSLPPTPYYTAHAYYHADGNGNITALLNASQTVVAKYLYDAFGNTLAQSGALTNANTYRFSSKEWNANSGLYYFLYRFYDPNLQRWLNRDPLMDAGSTVFDSMRKKVTKRVYVGEQRKPNAYEFVENTPLVKVDAYGLQSWMGPGYGSFGPGGVTGSGNPGQPGCNPPCPPGQTQKPYWQVMGYEDLSACATGEWSLIRDGIAGGLGGIAGTLIGAAGGPLGGVIGAGAGATAGGMYIPIAICSQQICN